MFGDIEPLFGKYSFNRAEITFQDSLKLLRARDVVPRLVNYRTYYKIFIKHVVVYLKSKKDFIEANGVYPKGLLAETVNIASSLIIDRLLFLEVLMIIAASVDYKNERLQLGEKVVSGD